jgi:hypothetical protein
MMLPMKKSFGLIFLVLVFAATAFAAVRPPGKVVKVDAQSITLHWDVKTTSMTQHHGMAGGGLRGTSREFTFKLTPQTTCWQGGKQVPISSIQKGATVQVTSEHGVASRIDILSS